MWGTSVHVTRGVLYEKEKEKRDLSKKERIRRDSEEKSRLRVIVVRVKC
jgi:hypothetical protein